MRLANAVRRPPLPRPGPPVSVTGRDLDLGEATFANRLIERSGGRRGMAVAFRSLMSWLWNRLPVDLYLRVDRPADHLRRAYQDDRHGSRRPLMRDRQPVSLGEA